MAKSKTTERDEKHDLSRRALIKWSLAAGAALGVSRSKIVEVLERSAGKGVAQAADQTQHRYFGTYMHNGGFAWSQLLWPHPEIAAGTNPQLSYHRLGQPNLAPAGTDKPLWLGVDSPFQNLGAGRQMSAFICGNNETHNNNATSTTTLGPNRLFAAIAAMQSTLPAVVPAIRSSDVGNDPIVFGAAPGAPAAATVATHADIINLFNSAASSAGGLLYQNGPDSALYKTTYSTFAGLVKASGRSTQIKTWQTGNTAAGFLGTNLASQLQVTPADEARYGITLQTRAPIAEYARLCIVMVKAFKLGLTNAVITNLFGDDPHGAFGGGDNSGDITSTVPALKMVYDSLMADLQETIVDGRALSDGFVMSIHGDTTKDARNRDGWGDGTDSNHNVTLAWGGGHIKTGWFGRLPLNGNVLGFNPATGDETTQYNGGIQAQAAASAIAYAVAGGDARLAATFGASSAESYAGLVNLISV